MGEDVDVDVSVAVWDAILGRDIAATVDDRVKNEGCEI